MVCMQENHRTGQYIKLEVSEQGGINDAAQIKAEDLDALWRVMGVSHH
jgi:hypothetical protein